ncbi:MAG: LamG domain-containing protein, partial [Verrucomicrobia bacterium]|nr:LamG domain-containing protein [Verrucomicrobiota bacterium]
MKMWKTVLLMLAAAVTLTAGGQNWITNGLVAYYPFNGSANDASGNAHHGTLANGVATVTDQFGNANSAFGFDGIDDSIVLPTSVMNNLTQGTFVATIYLNSYSTNGNPIISQATADLTDFMVAVSTNGRVQSPWITMANPQYLTGSQNVPLQKWAQVVVTWDGQYWKQYLNGQLDYQFESQAAPRFSTAPVELGHHAHCCVPVYFDGRIDEVRIYNRPLAAPEVEQLNLKSSLVAHYPFSNGSADDASGNGHHATVSGATPSLDYFGSENQAFGFDGNSQRIVVPASPAFEVRTNITIAAWLKRQQVGVLSPIVCKDDNQPNGSSHFEFTVQTNDALSFIYWAPGWVKSESSTKIADTLWHHVAASFDGQAVSLYIDGVPAGVVPQTIPMLPGNEPLQIGEAQASGFIYLNGQMDEVQIYNRGLSDYEVRQVYAVDSGRPYSSVGRAVRIDHLYLRVGTNYQLQ